MDIVEYDGNIYMMAKHIDVHTSALEQGGMRTLDLGRFVDQTIF